MCNKEMKKILTLAIVLLLTYSQAHAQKNCKVIDIESRLELFVDDYIIEKANDVEMVLCKPIPQEVAIVHDAPWEGTACGYHTVFRDGNLFRMYYRGADWDIQTRRCPHQVACYAQSTDGIHWIKPELGIIEFNGSKKNNIVWNGVGTHNFTPFKDANPACNQQDKYKALGTGDGGLWALKSPDGIHWSVMGDGPIITEGAFDSQNLAFWDTTRNRYVEFHRGFKNKVRDIMTCTSTDFKNWTDPVWLKYPGAPVEHLYTNQIQPYYRAPHIFIGFPNRFVTSRKVISQCPYNGINDSIFMTSRDGLRFKRWPEAQIRPGLQRVRWYNRNNYTAWGVLETKSTIAGAPNELSIYSTEMDHFGYSCKLRRFTLRIDGFVSVQAPLKGGQLITKPIAFQGKQLVINYSTSAAGSICVEIQDAIGKPIEGFTLADSPQIYGDELERVVSWKNGSDIGKLAGKPVKLCFAMKDANLYSLQFR